jgi:hypothetical protein
MVRSYEKWYYGYGQRARRFMERTLYYIENPQFGKKRLGRALGLVPAAQARKRDLNRTDRERSAREAAPGRSSPQRGRAAGPRDSRRSGAGVPRARLAARAAGTRRMRSAWPAPQAMLSAMPSVEAGLSAPGAFG